MKPALARIPVIDGLRAVAVAVIVLFHANIGGLGGGFIGVDVFFVISGFLMTRIIRHELTTGSFSFRAFYLRRICRILPALMAMLVVVTVLGACLLLPEAYKRYGASLIASVLFVANQHFLGQSGYFDTEAAAKPLLHLWSLAVEEQFYLLFPALLWLLHKYTRHHAPALILAAVATVSLGASALLLGTHPQAVFYLLPFRAWEFLLGALVALPLIPHLRAPLAREAAALTGLALLAASLLAFTAQTPFPGLAALLPCLGTTLVIFSCLPAAAPPPRAVRILLTPPCIWLGAISYSLYLWHWPVMVFLHTTMPQPPYAPFSPAARAVILLAMLVPAVVSYKLIEQPFRRGHLLAPRHVALAVMACALLLLGTGLAIKATRGWPGRLPAGVTRLDAFATSMNPRQTTCFHDFYGKRPNPQLTPEHACTYGAAVSPTWALWGDSHADTLITAMGEVAARHHQSISFLSGSACKPIIGTDMANNPTPACADFNSAVTRYLLATPAITTVVLAAYYPTGLSNITNPARTLTTPASQLAYATRQFKATVAQLQAAGKRVVLLQPVPAPGFAVPAVVAQAQWHGRIPAQVTHSYARYLEMFSPILTVMNALPASPQLVRINPAATFCDTTSCTVISPAGDPLYRDDNHLSLAGAARLAPQWEGLFTSPTAPTR